MQNMNNNLQLMAVAFDFFGKLDNEQISDLLEGKVSLRLQTSEDATIEALIEEKLVLHKADIDDKFKLLSQQIESLSTNVKTSSKISSVIPTEKPELSKKNSPVKNTSVGKSSKRTNKAGKSNKPSNKNIPTNLYIDIEPIVEELRTITTADALTEHLASPNLKYSTIQRIASRLGIKNANKITGEVLKDEITKTILQSQA